MLRNPNGTAAITDPSEDCIYSDRTLRGIMRAMVLDNLSQDGFMLPLDLPATETGTATRTYYGYELTTVWERMQDLTNVIDGPEFDFQPYFVSGTNMVRWQMLIGGPLLGNQQTTAVWDYGGALGSIDVDVNGSTSPAARVWVKGSGTDRSLLTGYAEDTSLVQQGFPPIDYVDSEHTSATEQSTLEDYADADLAAFRFPTEQWTCSVRIDGARFQETGVEISPALGNWQLGDAPTFYVSGHPWLPDGGYRRRIIGFSGDGPEHVKLKFDETSQSATPTPPGSHGLNGRLERLERQVSELSRS
ncbi:hypothetical protein [Saccharopolyspora phatthalungensis]|uniref:Minor tail protein n=1 Tax=Saccharopolyspora phatthalungensis TaxID=664693 RepID=A0A840QHC1_9PSEU|nr:hypothetical protein [Saccharopolyspora phatthalungensis]MBB5159906.1 hypothetical protein [Saccharopolyspora phatthalungensis]